MFAVGDVVTTSWDSDKLKVVGKYKDAMGFNLYKMSRGTDMQERHLIKTEQLGIEKAKGAGVALLPLLILLGIIYWVLKS